MDRRAFIKSGCMVCLIATVSGNLIPSCTPLAIINGKMNKDGLIVDASEFIFTKNKKQQFRSSIILRNETLQYPICIFRINENEYNAVWMRCSHQGTELKISGQHLYCSAHGSEFAHNGKVINGPAAKDLQTFPVTINKNELFIDLRK